MKIYWNKVTWTSQIAAIVLFVVTFALGFVLGMTYEYKAFVNSMQHPVPVEKK